MKSTTLQAPQRRVRRDAVAGYSLLELMIVVALVGIIGALTVPSFVRYLNVEKLNASSKQLINAFMSSRSSAITFGSSVLLCASENGQSCSTDWTKGWLAFHDEDNSLDIESGETILQQFTNDDEAIAITVESSSGEKRNYVQFNYRGFLDTPTVVTLARKETERTLTLSIFGKPKLL